MGFLYVFPTSEKFQEHLLIERDQQQIPRELTVKTLGLPYVFWFYFAAILVLLVGMFLAIKAPLQKLLTYPSSLNLLLYYACLGLMLLVPFGLLAAFFYEKQLHWKAPYLTIRHKVFFLTLKKRSIKLQPNSFSLDHFMDSPNKARLSQNQEFQSYENRGYFELKALDQHHHVVWIDRHSQKRELQKLQELLESVS